MLAEAMTKQTETTFESIHRDSIIGKLSLADRVIFKGYLGFSHTRGMRAFLSGRGVLLKDFGRFAERLTTRVKQHAKSVAAEANRPFISLKSPHTARSELSKEALAQEIAKRDGIREGLICVLSVLEPCSCFDVRGNHETHRLELVRRPRTCLQLYFYFLDPEFGFMHVRLQSWLPFSLQLYINGREWLCRQLDQRGIGYERYDNALLRIDDLEQAHRLCRRFFRRRWPGWLDRFARLVNPHLANLRRLGFPGYYWVADQCEMATDVMFKSRQALESLLPDLFEHASQALSAEDTLRFLGRKFHGNLRAEVTADHKRRREGRRVKFRLKRNSIKMYDKWSVLRIETTINNPREFKTLRILPGHHRRHRRWVRMGKGVANFWRYGQVGAQANHRFLAALAHAVPKRPAIAQLDRLCRPRTVHGHRFSGFNPVADHDCRLFQAALLGGHLLNGFRNRDLAAALDPSPPRSDADARRRRERTSRLIRKLRAHGLVAKVPRSRLYRVTPHGYHLMSTAVRYRLDLFPSQLLAAA